MIGANASAAVEWLLGGRRGEAVALVLRAERVENPVALEETDAGDRLRNGLGAQDVSLDLTEIPSSKALMV